MVNKQGNSRACGLTGLQNIHTDKQMWSLSEASIYKHTTNWQIAGRMDGWRADWGMWKWWISEWTCEDRLTRRVKDKWRSATGCRGGLTIWLGYLANVSTHRCARKKKKTPPTIPLVCMQALSTIKVYLFFFAHQKARTVVRSAELVTYPAAGPHMVQDRLRSGLCAPWVPDR